MGATVSTGKLAAAFEASNGSKVYVLFEQTYEKNVRPHNPHWGCITFGPIETVMRAIFLGAGSCESGMLQGKGGRALTPEGYISGWLKELANPVEFQDRTITLQVSESMYAPIPKESFKDVADLLVSMGRNDVADALAGGETASLSLFDDTDLLGAIYSRVLAPWRIIRSHETPLHGLRRLDLGYAPVKPKNPSISIPSFLTACEDLRLVKTEDGFWRSAGHADSATSSFIARSWEAELREPGSYKQRLKALREAISSAPKMPAGTKVAIDRTVVLESRWDREDVERAESELATNQTKTGFEIELNADPAVIRKASFLPEACTIWLVPEPSTQASGSVSPPKTAAALNDLDLQHRFEQGIWMA